LTEKLQKKMNIIKTINFSKKERDTDIVTCPNNEGGAIVSKVKDTFPLLHQFSIYNLLK